MCKFCEEYNQIKEIFKEIPLPKGMYRHYKVRLYVYSTRNRQRGGTITYRARPLNFCPECGKSLKKKKEAEHE